MTTPDNDTLREVAVKPLDLQYLAAVGLMVTNQRGSTSFLQRNLSIGYSAANALMLKMEIDGIVAKPNHVGKREVTVKPGMFLTQSADIANLQTNLDHWRHEVGKLHSQVSRQADENTALRAAHDADLAVIEGLRTRVAELEDERDSWRGDCELLLANIDTVAQATGEGPEDEDAIIVEGIRAALSQARAAQQKEADHG